MRFYAFVQGDYITQFGKGGHGGETISEERYNSIKEAVANAPTNTDYVTHYLRTDLTWEAVDVEPVEDNISDEEVLDIIFGGESI